MTVVVGNGFGDVLHLAGKGDGTFQITGNRVSLSVVPNLLGAGQAGVLVGNQQDNSVTVQTATAGGNQLTTVQTLGGGSGTQLASLFLQVRINGDVALLQGVGKTVPGDFYIPGCPPRRS